MSTLLMLILIFANTQQASIHVPAWNELKPLLPLLLKIFPFAVVGFYLGQWFIHSMGLHEFE